MSNQIESKNSEKNKEVYRRYIQEIFNEGRFEHLAELVSPSYVLKDAPPGTPSGMEAIKQIATLFRIGLPDLNITIEDLIGEGDLVAARATTRGTHKGTIFGIAPTGKPVTMVGLTMVRIQNGRICESWVRNDMMGLMKQLEPQK